MHAPRKRARIGWALALAVSLHGAGSARANPVDTYGLGSRSVAMGGAVSAGVRDFSASYYNPSGLVLSRGTDLSVGYGVVNHSLELDGHDSKVDPVRGIVGGAVAPGSVGFLPFAFGIATHLNDQRLSRARGSRQDDPRWVMYDNRPQLLYLSANLAVRPLPYLAIGGGVTWLAATRGRFSIRGTAVLPSGSRTEYDSQLEHEVDADLSSVRYPSFGVTVSPVDEFDFALVYRGQAEIELAIDAALEGDVDATLVKVPARYTLTSTTTNAFIPQQVVAGTTFKPSDALRIGLDVTWVNWAAWKSPVSRSRTVLEVNVPAGFELPPNPEPTAVEDPRFSDRLVPRLGVEYLYEINREFTLPLRGGYVFERSPVPPQTGVTNYVDSDRHVLSVGTGLVWNEPGPVLPGNLRLDLHAQWSILPTRVTLKENPADYVGDYRARGTIFGAGATLSVGFE